MNERDILIHRNQIDKCIRELEEQLPNSQLVKTLTGAVANLNNTWDAYASSLIRKKQVRDEEIRHLLDELSEKF